MDQNGYTFGRDFRLKLLSLLLDGNWMAKYGSSIIIPEYFEQEDEETISRAILDYREAYHRSPKDSTDILVLTEGKYEDTINTIVEGFYEWDLSLAADKAIEFAQEQAFKLAMLEGIGDVEKGNLNSPMDRMKKALAVGNVITSPGIDPIRDVDRWLYDIYIDKVSTMWTHVDYILDGGLSKTELGILLAPPNQGKSMGLINVGYGAASLLGHKNVAHFTHEMGVRVVAKRYAARMMFRFPSKEDDLKAYEDELLAVARKMMPGRIRIIGNSGKKMTITEMDGHLARLVAEGFELGLIIDDYPDLLEPPKHYSDRRFELSAIYEALRELGSKYGVPVWGASQSSRASLSKDIITMADIAEDIGKAAIADVIIAICQTWEESQANLCRLFMAKVRDGENKAIINAKYYKRSQAIVTTGFVKDNPKRDV